MPNNRSSKMLIACCLSILLFCAYANAEVIKLKNGRTINGAVVKGSADKIVVDIGVGEATINKKDISKIEKTQVNEASKYKEQNNKGIYYSKKYGLEIKLPEGWLAIDETTPDRFFKECEGNTKNVFCVLKENRSSFPVLIYFTSNMMPKDYTMEEYSKELKATNLLIQKANPDLEIIENNNMVSLNGNKFSKSITKIKNPEQMYVYYHFLNGRMGYSIIGSLAVGKFEMYKDIIEKVAAGVRFTDKRTAEIKPSGGKENMTPDSSSAKTYYDRGFASGTSGNYSEALSDFNKAIERNPDYTDAYNARGQAYKCLGDYNKARQDFNKAIELDPNYADAFCNLGAICQSSNDFTGALANYKKAIEVNPKHVNAYNNAGSLYAKSKQFDQAISFYKKALEIDPKDEASNYNIGNAYGFMKQYKEAIGFYKKVIEINPSNAMAYSNLGIVYGYDNQPGNAKTNLKKAEEICQRTGDYQTLQKVRNWLRALGG